MIYCINPQCPNPKNADNMSFCQSCGSQLQIDGRYWVIRPLGKGGFGQTYEVHDREVPKVLKVLTCNQPIGVELFQREAQILMRLRHPGLPAVEPSGYFTFTPNHSQDRLHCLVMQKIEGVNLQEWLKARHYHPIDSEQALDWLEQLTRILHLVHNQNYFHRDIKPSNIMLRPNGQNPYGQLVLIDFGAVRQITETVERQTMGKITRICSYGYTPPEQIQGNAEPRSDFFALGRTLVYLVTGQEPSNLPEDPRNNRLNWRTLAPQISKPVADLIDDLMAPSPEGRPQNTQVLLQRLAKLNPAEDSGQKIALHKNQIWMGAVGFAVAIALFVFVPKLLSQEQKENFLPYQNSLEGFSLKYPEKWDKQELVLDNFNRDAVKFVSPVKNESDSSKEEITVTIDDFKSKPMSLEEYNQSAINEIKKNLTDVIVVDESSVTLADTPGHKIIFTAKDGQKDLKKMQVWTVKNNKAYVITYTAEKENYSDSLKDVEQMVDFFKIN